MELFEQGLAVALGEVKESSGNVLAM